MDGGRAHPIGPGFEEAPIAVKGSVTAAQEIPLFLNHDASNLFGILTEPQGAPNGIGVVWLPTGSTFHRNAFPVRLMRRLSARGFTCLRIDWRGLGESTGQTWEGRAHIEKVATTDAPDVAMAANWLVEEGLNGVIVVGHCSGARAALVATPEIERLAGLAAISVPMADRSMQLAHRTPSFEYLKRGLSASSLRGLLDAEIRKVYWRHIRLKASVSVRMLRRPSDAPFGQPTGLNPEVVAQLEALARRQVPVVLIYGSDDRAYHEVSAARSSLYHVLDEPAKALVELPVPLSGHVHNYRSLRVQEDLLEAVTAWVVDIPGRIDSVRP